MESGMDTLRKSVSSKMPITNKPIPPQLKLTKVVTGNVALPTSWNLAAKVGATIVAQGDGGTAGFVDVSAGETITLSESTALPNADQFQAGDPNPERADTFRLPGGELVVELAAG